MNPPRPAESEARSQVLAGRSVVVCRASDQASVLLDAIVELGGRAVALPLLEVAEPADGGAGLARALAGLDGFDWVVLTSANAVRAVHARCPELPSSLRVAVVGPATARAVTDAGWPVDFEPTEATAEALAKQLPSAKSAWALAPLAELANDTIERLLRERGATVDRVDAYRMRTPQHAADVVDAALAADAVLLTSPSSADRFAELASASASSDDRRSLPTAIVIGPTTAAAAVRRGFDVIGTADPHTEDGLLAALVRSIGA